MTVSIDIGRLFMSVAVFADWRLHDDNVSDCFRYDNYMMLCLFRGRGFAFGFALPLPFGFGFANKRWLMADACIIVY